MRHPQYEVHNFVLNLNLKLLLTVSLCQYFFRTSLRGFCCSRTNWVEDEKLSKALAKLDRCVHENSLQFNGVAFFDMKDKQ